jgi:hypothetical protein
MNRKLTTEQRVFILQYWGKTNKNSVYVLEMFAEEFRDTPVPTRQAIYNLNQRFKHHGSAHILPRSGRPRNSLTEENLTTAAKAFVPSPKKYIGKTSVEYITPPTSVC